MNDTEYCVLCGKQIPTESGKHYCEECEKKYLKENEMKAVGYVNKHKSEN